MANSVTLNNDIIEVVVDGDQTEQTVKSMGKKVAALLKQLNAEGKPGLIIDDISRLGSTDIAARKAVTELAYILPFKKAAMIGDGSMLMRVGTRLLIKAAVSPRSDAVRYFEDRQKAMEWLFSE